MFCFLCFAPYASFGFLHRARGPFSDAFYQKEMKDWRPHGNLSFQLITEKTVSYWRCKDVHVHKLRPSQIVLQNETYFTTHHGQLELSDALIPWDAAASQKACSEWNSHGHNYNYSHFLPSVTKNWR